jgi:membrane protein DedA with SNARE-associated domain
MSTIYLIEMVENFYTVWGYPFVFLSSLIETSPLGFTVPGGLIVAVGGFFAYAGKVSFVGILLAGTLGMQLTFIIAYYAGKKTGKKLIKRFKQEKNAKKSKTAFNQSRSGHSDDLPDGKPYPLLGSIYCWYTKLQFS